MGVSAHPIPPPNHLICLTCASPCSAHWRRTTGLNYEERYKEYEEEYDDYAEECRKDGVEPEKKVRYKAGFHAIEGTKTIPQQMNELKRLFAKGVVLTSPAPRPLDSRGERMWCTDKIELVPQKTLVCYQAALVHATSSTLPELGMLNHTHTHTHTRAFRI